MKQFFNSPSPQVRGTSALLLASLIAGVLHAVVFSAYGFEPVGNPFIEALMPLLFVGAPLLVAGSFIFSIVALASEKDPKNRRLIAMALVSFILIAYLMSYFLFVGEGGFDSID